MLKISFQNQVLSIDPLGGGIVEYYLKNGRERINLIYGYSKLKDKDGCMGDILSPFPGRVDKGQYKFGGKEYKLKGFKKDKNGHTLHAFVNGLRWDLRKKDAEIEARCQIDKSNFEKFGYPFSLDYKINYKLGSRGLTVNTMVRNVGDCPAPFGIGFHPYFAVADKVDQIEWQVPANKLVQFNKQLMPTGRMLSTANSKYDFRKPRKIGRLILDNCFYGLKRDKEGIFKSILKNPETNFQIIVWQDKNFPYFQTYSSDTIQAKNRRRAIALEPQTSSGFAVNFPKLGLIKLKPEYVFKGKWGVSYKL